MTFVTVTNALPGDESLEALSDAEIIASVKSEINAFLDGACWIVERGVCKALDSMWRGSTRSSRTVGAEELS